MTTSKLLALPRQNERPPETDSERLRRIETKLTVFAEALGVDIEADRDWLSVDNNARVIYVTTMGRSLLVINKTAKKRGATQKGKAYSVMYKGKLAGTLVIH